jgi:hypothetical protein
VEIETPVGKALVASIDGKALAAHRLTWVPCLEGEDDEHWSWSDFIQGIETEYGRDPDQFLLHFSLWMNDLLQAQMIISGPHVCVSKENLGLTAMYVEYAAVAPWNRPEVRRKGLCIEYPRGAALGSALFTVAISRSIEMDLGGRLAWHSLPKVEDSYRAMFARKCHEDPIDCGIDVGSGNRLFEINSEMASAWIRSGGVA